MLIRLTPDQVSERWNAIGQAIIGSFVYDEAASPTSNQALQWLMEGRLHCWINTKPDGKVDAVLTTCFVPDTPFDTYSLLIFSLWASKGNGAAGDWVEGMESVKRFAKENGASTVLFFTKNPSVEAFGRRIEADEKSCFKVEVI